MRKKHLYNLFITANKRKEYTKRGIQKLHEALMVCKILKIRNMRNKGTLTKNGMYTHGKLEKNKKNNAQNDPLKNLH